MPGPQLPHAHPYGGIHLPSTAPEPRGISFVIPAYNEEKRLRPTLDAYIPMLRSLGVPFELTVVVSGNDGTWDLVQEYAAQGVKGIRSLTRMGKGRAIIEGFRHARFPIIGYADADGSVEPDGVASLLRAALAGERAIVASRRLRPEMTIQWEPAPKHFASAVWHGLVRLLLELPLRDAECGCKVFSWEVKETILREVIVTNWVFDVTMLFHVYRSGVDVKEVPVVYKYDERTRMRLLKVFPVMLLTLFAVFTANRTHLLRYVPTSFIRSMNRRFATE